MDTVRTSALDDGYPAHRVLCFHCGSEYVHFAGEPVMEVSDDYPKGGIGMRGTYLSVPMYCESNCPPFLFVVQFHKGNMFVANRAAL